MPRISEFPAASTVTSDDVLLGNDGTTAKRFPVDVVADYVSDVLGPGSGGRVGAFFVHVDDYGAVPDSVYNAGTGTDSTAAIQAAIDDTFTSGQNGGKIVLIGPGKYKTTGPIVLRQGTQLMSFQNLRTAAVGNDATEFATRIDFYGADGDNCIESIGTGTGISRIRVEGLKITDRRTSPTSGWGIYLERCVNQVELEHLDIDGFPDGGVDGAGGGIRVTAQSGQSSDCVRINDIWFGAGATGAPGRAIYCDRVDNQLHISDIKCDTLAASGQDTVVYIENLGQGCGVIVETVKHENSDSACRTVFLGIAVTSARVGPIVARGSSAGPIFVTDQVGSGITILDIWRSTSGTLIQTSVGAWTGGRLPLWVGGADGVAVGGCIIRGDTNGGGTWDRMLMTGHLQAASSPITVGGGTTAKLAARADLATDLGLVVAAHASQSADIVGFVNAAGTVRHLAIEANGTLVAESAVKLAGASSALGFYGSAGAVKPTVTGSKGANAALGSLLTALASLGLITDSSS